MVLRKQEDHHNLARDRTNNGTPKAYIPLVFFDINLFYNDLYR